MTAEVGIMGIIFIIVSYTCGLLVGMRIEKAILEDKVEKPKQSESKDV